MEVIECKTAGSEWKLANATMLYVNLCVTLWKVSELMDVRSEVRILEGNVRVGRLKLVDIRMSELNIRMLVSFYLRSVNVRKLEVNVIVR